MSRHPVICSPPSPSTCFPHQHGDVKLLPCFVEAMEKPSQLVPKRGMWKSTWSIAGCSWVLGDAGQVRGWDLALPPELCSPGG